MKPVTCIELVIIGVSWKYKYKFTLIVFEKGPTSLFLCRDISEKLLCDTLEQVKRIGYLLSNKFLGT